MPKLDRTKRQRTIPCATQPVIYAHTCEIDGRTSTGSEAWAAINSPEAQRVDANRALHQLTGSHEAAAAAVASATARNANQTIDTVQLRTLVRVVKQLEKES